ncbi:MAG: hypothetical protein C0421_07435 [Hyphomonas sp.]|nr:hypothetical protein [Hyphomonas sp.]
MAADGEGFFERAGRPGAPGLAEPAPSRRAAHAAAFGLLLRHPGKSALQTLSEGQRLAFLQGFALLGSGGLMAPDLLVGVCGLLGVAVLGAVLLFRIWLYLCGLRESSLAATSGGPPADEDEDRPVYTLLIALKDEADTAAQLAAAPYAAGMGMALAAPGRKDWRRAALAATLPVYWPLQSIAMGRALYGLAKCPNFWAKTPHRADAGKIVPEA